MLYISIHSPHARGDHHSHVRVIDEVEFQSTPLMRGETLTQDKIATLTAISIHSPHARGDCTDFEKKTSRDISIHSPHARGDLVCSDFANDLSISIHSPHARGDELEQGQNDYKDISIHSPHARGDAWWALLTQGILFQSTPLMRGETWAVNHLFTIFRFQSTPLMRGETAAAVCLLHLHCISIHSPHARGDDNLISLE